MGEMPRLLAREKLLDAAERLFADHGLAGVSLRAINAAAGLSPAALHYHFGNQQRLLEALLDRRMPGLMGHRSGMLDALEMRPDPPTVREVLDTLVHPLRELIADTGEVGLRYVRMVHRLQQDESIDPNFVLSRWPSGVDRLIPLLQRALPELSEGLIGFRLDMANRVILGTLAKAPTAAPARVARYASALLDFITGALEAPASSLRPARTRSGRTIENPLEP